MIVRHLLLIECLDAAGAAVHDVRTRARAVIAAGWQPRCAVTGSGRDAWQAVPVPTDLPVVPAGAAGPAFLRRWAVASSPDAVLVASALPGGGAVGRWAVEAGLPAWWWPTGIGASAGAPASTRAAPGVRADDAGPLPLVPLPVSAALDAWTDGCAGLEAGVLDDARDARRALPLWDGDYVLAPTPLCGEAGTGALDAFATLCGLHDGLDLVVLGDPQTAFERFARARGIGFRVHFAGAATRVAERAWLAGAAAILVAGDAPLSGGLALRALACGRPLLAARGGVVGAPLEAWLAARGLAIGAADDPPATRLGQALDLDADWRRRAAAAVVRHGIEAAGRRLGDALERRREAA